MGSWSSAGRYLPGDGAYVYLTHFTSQEKSQTYIPRFRVPQGEPKEKHLLWSSASGNRWAIIFSEQLAWLLPGWQGGHTVRRSNSKRECGIHIFFLDSDHDGDRDTRISQTGVLISVNKAPIQLYSKQQNTVETSLFSSEFIDIKTETELVKALCYKLWMFGIPIEGPINMFCDNEAVYKNASTPESTLKRKNVSICYHKYKEAVTYGVSRISK